MQTPRQDRIRRVESGPREHGRKTRDQCRTAIQPTRSRGDGMKMTGRLTHQPLSQSRQPEQKLRQPASIRNSVSSVAQP